MSLFINFLIGSCLGSNAAWLAQSFASGSWSWRSHCNVCRQELSLLEEVPIISYLCLHGRCRFCHSSIPTLLFFTELWGGLSFLPFGLNQRGVAFAIFTFFFLVLALMDLQYEEIDLLLLSVPLLLAMWQSTSLAFLPVLLILVALLAWFAKRGLLGSGDVYCLVVLGLFWQQAICHLLLLACLFCLGAQLLLKSRRTGFVPYLYLAHLCLCYLLFWA